MPSINQWTHSGFAVIFLAVHRGAVRDFMLAAYDLGYINGEFVFIDPKLTESRGTFGNNIKLSVRYEAYN